jgi:A/G-specific adenine glycosylase
VKSIPHSHRVLKWWDAHRRELPWRAARGKTSTPYVVWLSEVLLQQTTVQAATPYFERFVRTWPRVEDLAAATLEDVMRAFSGLGYYSRARNLHACARAVAANGGRFPESEAELRALPGVGAYTAAAVAAIAFGQSTTPVDGNISRIVGRLFAIEEPFAMARSRIVKAATSLTPRDRPGDYAQALMDLGSMICTPRNPSCSSCPLREDCMAQRSGDPAAFPRRVKRKVRPVRQGAVFFAQRADGAILVRTRPPTGLLGSTVELPGTEWSVDFDIGQAGKSAPICADWRLLMGSVKQAFTHFQLRIHVFYAPVAGAVRIDADCVWLQRDRIHDAGFSSVMRKVVTHALESRPAS